MITGRASVLALMACLIVASAFGQLGGGLSLPDLFKLKSEPSPEATQLRAQVVPLDAAVDPAQYYVGPGDVVVMNIWSSAPAVHQLTVTPEATLLIPNVGIVDLQDQTLESAKKKVAAAVGRRYPSSDVSLTLLQPRRIIVQITGSVLNEGKHEISALHRVDNLIGAANSLPSPAVDANFVRYEIPRLRNAASQRNIIIQRKNGETIRIDLLKYQVTGKGKYNPYLREGDQVYVPSKRANSLAIGVFGAVKREESFEFVQGDSLGDLVAMGFGFKDRADLVNATLFRLSPDASLMERVSVDLLALKNQNKENIALRPGDRLFVPEVRELRQSFVASIEGAVVQPGTYPITAENTKLSEVVRLTGGFTPQANIKAATLYRARISPQSEPGEIAQEQLLSSRTNLGLQDSSYYFIETALRIKGEIVSVDFERLFVKGDSTADITLRPYDRVVVPARSKNVYVFGQVLSPGHVEYVDGQNYLEYIARAGGFTQDAREGDVKIIKGSTRAWLDPGETKIEDGDYLWVPKERQYSFAYYLNTYAQIAGIAGTVATIALLINNLTK